MISPRPEPSDQAGSEGPPGLSQDGPVEDPVDTTHDDDALVGQVGTALAVAIADTESILREALGHAEEFAGEQRDAAIAQLTQQQREVQNRLDVVDHQFRLSVQTARSAVGRTLAAAHATAAHVQRAAANEGAASRQCLEAEVKRVVADAHRQAVAIRAAAQMAAEGVRAQAVADVADARAEAARVRADSKMGAHQELVHARADAEARSRQAVAAIEKVRDEAANEAARLLSEADQEAAATLRKAREEASAITDVADQLAGRVHAREEALRGVLTSLRETLGLGASILTDQDAVVSGSHAQPDAGCQP